jgi:deferrochelatase/peroxidase EfeB
LLRRGIPYGPPLPEGVLDDDGIDRGLLFVAYQASIAGQFEYLQRRWAGDPDFPRTADGADPLAGRATSDHTVSFRAGGRSVRLQLDQFVKVRGGGYFFAPSIAALAELAGASRPIEDTTDHDRAPQSAAGDVQVRISVGKPPHE